VIHTVILGRRKSQVYNMTREVPKSYLVKSPLITCGCGAVATAEMWVTVIDVNAKTCSALDKKGLLGEGYRND